MKTEVKITNIDINFWDMVRFMVKWAFACIPAGIIIFIIWSLFLASWIAFIGR